MAHRPSRSQEATGSGSSFEVTAHPVGEHLRVLGRLRGEHPFLSVGATVVRQAQGATLAVSRLDASAGREYLAAFNTGETTVRVTVPTGTQFASWTALLGGSSVSSDAAGRITLQLPPLAARLYRADAELPAPAPAPVPCVELDTISEPWSLDGRERSSPPGDPLRRPPCGLVAVAPPRGGRLPPLRGSSIRRRTGAVSSCTVAVARWRGGSVTTSPVVPFTVRPA